MTGQRACEFIYDDRLGIELPHLNADWEDISVMDRASILEKWETIRGRIPDRIKELECIIMKKQDQLNYEESFQRSCMLNSEIAALASTINDLHLWYRVNQEMDATSTKSHQ